MLHGAQHFPALPKEFHYVEQGFLGVQYKSYSAPIHLLCADGEHREVNAVEFVKAAPEAALSEALVDLPHALIVHLVAAVEHHYILAQRVAQILRRHPQDF